jgi:D-3-phosphoglycerate dehydrogenase
MKVLLIDDVHEILTDGLKNAGFDVDYQPDLDKEDFFIALKKSKPTGIVVRSKLNIQLKHLQAMKELGVEWIARAGAGVDNIDVEAAEQLGIRLIHAIGANADSVAEHMVGMLLGLRHNLYRSHTEVLKFQWNREKNRGFEIKGKTVGIIGYGHTGSKLAEKLSGFGVRILAYDKYNPVESNSELTFEMLPEITSPETGKRFTDGVLGVELDVLKRESDIISFHVPLTVETRNWVNDEFFEGCKSGLVLLNGSRGEVIQLKSVLNAIETGTLGGFAADVLEVEPPIKMNAELCGVFEKLGSFSNVMFSPHIAGWSTESYRQISEVLLRKILIDS